MATRVLTLLLPKRRHFAGQAPGIAMARAMARADPSQHAPGELAQQRRPFRLRPAGAWPSAALIEAHQRRRSDVQPFQWLRADPVWLQPDLTTARLMAWGNLGLSDAEAQALAAPLGPLFGDFGYVFDVREPESWVLQCPMETRFPSFPHPLDALGDDAFPHLPEGADARRWRSLMGEAQVVLHQHPVNAARSSRGLPPANSLWFWGAGSLPDAVDAELTTVATADPELAAYAHAAGANVGVGVDATRPGLIDLRAERRWSVVEDVAAVSLAAMRAGSIDTVRMDFADGHVLSFMPGQRWRFWKRAFAGFDA